MVDKDQPKFDSSPYHHRQDEGSSSLKPIFQNTSDGKNLALLQEYFSCIDGTDSSWGKISPLYPKVLHEDLRFVVSYGTEMNYNEFQETLKAHCLSGNISKLESWEENPDGTLTALINILPDGKVQCSKQTHWYKDGKIVRVEIDPSDSDKVEHLVEKLQANIQGNQDRFSGEACATRHPITGLINTYAFFYISHWVMLYCLPTTR